MAWAASSASCLALCSRLPLPSPRCSTTPSQNYPSPPPSSYPPPLENAARFPISRNPCPALSPLSISVSNPSHPSLQFANLMWFKGAFNAQIFVGENEPAESAVRRFRKAVMQAGVIPECRRRRFFETPQDIKKRKKQALQRRRMRRYSPRTTGGEKKETSESKADDDDDDNWGYAEDGVEVD